MQTKRYLVTGGTGCIGAWVVRNLINEEFHVVVLDHQRDHHRLELILNSSDLANIKFEQGDITDLKSLCRIFKDHQITHVIHLAALQLPFCKANPSLGARVDVVGTINVFEAAKSGGIHHVVYASSAAVYGPKDCYPKEPLKHDARLIPSSHYGVYKQANEIGAKVYWQNDSISSIGLRPYVVYGPGRDQGMTSTPTKAMLAAASGRPYKISFGGRYCFQYVDDVANVFIRASQTSFNGADVYNIGGSAPTTESIIQAIENIEPSMQGKISFDTNLLPFPEEYENVLLKKLLGEFKITQLINGVQETMQLFKGAIDDGKITQKEIDKILAS